MINLVSAVRAEQHSKKCATCGMALARFYNITADLILHLPDHRLIRREPRFIVWVGGLDVGQVEVVLHLNHVLLDVRRLDVIHQEVCIREEEMCLLPVPRLDDVVVEPIE